MILPLNGDSDPRRMAADRKRISSQVVTEWRSAGRYDYSDAEIDAEIDRRYADLSRRRAESRQLQLPLMDVGQVAAKAKRDSCRSTRQARIGRRARVVELLEQAGSRGMTREEIAAAIPKCKDSSVSSPVRYLLDRDLACEPLTRASSAGIQVAVVVLSQFAGGLDHA